MIAAASPAAGDCQPCLRSNLSRISPTAHSNHDHQGTNFWYPLACGHVTELDTSIRCHREAMRPDEPTIVISEGAERSHDFSGHAQLEYSRAIRCMLGLVTTVHHVDESVRANANRPGSTKRCPAPHGQEPSRRVEHLDSGVSTIGHIDAACGVDGDSVGHVELAGAVARLSPFAHELAGWAELDDAGVPVSIADINRPIGALRHVSGSVEMSTIGAPHPRLPEREELSPVVGELEDLMESDVSQPNTPLSIHTEAVWHSESARPPGSDQLTCLGTEAKHRWLSDWFAAQRVGCRKPAATRPAEDEDIARCVDAHPRTWPSNSPGGTWGQPCTTR